MSQHRSRTSTTPSSATSAEITSDSSPINLPNAGSCGLANLVEQLRPSIAGIVGFSELLEFTDLDDEQAEFVAAISTASRQLDRLLSAIGALQDSSAACDDRTRNDSIPAGELQHDTFGTGFDGSFVMPAVCTVRELIDQAVSAVADHAAEREIEILADATGDEHPILVDEGGLAVVLTNLVSNAVAYSNGRRVRVAAVRVRSDDEFETYRFAVSDDGGSLDPTRTARIFDNDRTAAVDYTAAPQHAWGGLAANQEWVARHGGQIEVAVDPGTSTTFWFDIPVAVAYTENAA